MARSRMFDRSRKALDGKPLLVVASNAWKFGTGLPDGYGVMSEKVAERLGAYVSSECTRDGLAQDYEQYLWEWECDNNDQV